jgi:glycine dehydrogenase subunit 1
MAYIPHTEDDRREMLAAIGVGGLDDLYQAVPEAVRFPDLDLPSALSEMEIMDELQALAEANLDMGHTACFLGAGAYNHFIPSVVDHILRRNEFYTAYTPYQPEVSQGTLQAIFEYQSLISNLTGMDVANASLYDGATALAESISMALSHYRGKRSRIVLSPAIHPHYRAVARTYLRGMDVHIAGDEAVQTDLAALTGLVDAETALVAVQYPDFFGRIEDFTALGEAAHAAGALLCVVINPLALGLLKPPSEFGADIVVGEGQPLGIPLSYGGPYLGLMATTQDLVRKMPGRLVGETVDTLGRRGYVLTLTPREQHIRREKATSNICTNQGLMALAALVYLAALGKGGLRQVAELCYQKAHYAADKIAGLDAYALWGEVPFFNEFVVRCPRPVAEINTALLEEHEILGGYDLGLEYPELEQHMLVAVTERNDRDEIDDLVGALQEVANA